MSTRLLITELSFTENPNFKYALHHTMLHQF
jgi:hypothetical protein